MNLRIVLVILHSSVPITGMAQNCNLNIHLTAPVSRFVVNAARGTVLDKRTGLIWKRCVEGRLGTNCASGDTQKLSWGGALSKAATSNHAGYTDWRLPNVKELKSLVEAACYGPALNTTVFPNDPSTTVWTSSPYNYWIESPGPDHGAKMPYSWTVSFSDGQTGFNNRYSNYTNYGSVVRLVRGGQ